MPDREASSPVPRQRCSVRTWGVLWIVSFAIYLLFSGPLLSAWEVGFIDGPAGKIVEVVYWPVLAFERSQPKSVPARILQKYEDFTFPIVVRIARIFYTF